MTAKETELEIKNRLREFRQRNKLSQEDLAGELGISRQSVIALEQGKHMPSLPLAINVCRFFDSAFEDVFQLHDEISREIDKAFETENNIKIINKPKEAEKENKMNELEPMRPFREMVSLRDAMDRLFEDSVITPKSVGMPKIDVKDGKNEVVVKAELPGISEDELDIEVCDGVMTISGEKKEEKEEEKEGYYYKESHSGAFSRSFSLPSDVDEEKAEADMDKGVLKITLPKIKPKKAKKVTLIKRKK